MVPLVAGVLPLLAVERLHRHLEGPRAFPSLRVVDGRLVEQRPGVDAGQPLGQAHAAGSGAPLPPGVEVRRLDDERVALPVAARLARPLEQVRRQRRTAVERDDARGVHHLRHDRDVVRGLEHLDVVVVGARRHRRPGVEPQEAAVVGAEVQPRVGRLVAPVLAARLDAAPALGRQRRVAPVRRVDDQRRAARRHRFQALIEPGVVVGAVAAVRPPVDVAAHRGPLRRQLQEVVQTVERLPLQVGHLLFGQELLLGERLRPLHPRDAAVVPDAPEVGRVPSGPRRLGLGAGGRRGQDGERRRGGASERDHSTAHLALPFPQD